ncbi:FMN-dependent NADH-azoreductase [Neobacillus vireti]|uniref:FMN dependent NADH:quinone oxidoreductase n=1 Tax=Neobacillus vireti LMG 21834 TaxID=1131730 RepID=A0AB94IG68_9BACI|nr:NAD(P)H-dependent oxidoreductase [Neobacillus vireti]ETI66106.1 ACP phosphodieterase [Neobacillus vireti LMG 21834]KLT18385.1 NAD(P)H dehydrogenase [Neobacillus vireti]
MSKLIYITANPKSDSKLSKGMQIGEVFLEEFKSIQPDVEIEHMHLYDMDIPEIDMDLLYGRAKLSFMGYTKEQLSEAERTKLEKMHALADRFIAADYYVFVTPIWNLGAPAILKSFMDCLFIAEKTFTNTADGPKGLLTGRKAIHIQTRGGIYSSGPMVEFEMGDRYLMKALKFLGFDLIETVVAEGMDHYPKKAPEIIAKAKEQAAEAAREMAKQTVTL